MDVCTTHGVLFQGSRFWIVYRRRRYGPFDYEWSKDFAGVELTYAGRKFGEYCSKEEIFADLKEFHLPAPVVQVASIVMGCLVLGILNGYRATERTRMIVEQLTARGFERFAQIQTDPEPRLADRKSEPPE